MITTTIENHILIVPDIVYGYNYTSKNLFILPNNKEKDLNIIYQQAFNLFDDSTLYFDMYDLALNRYRVWRLGRDILAPDKFEVEFLQQF